MAYDSDSLLPPRKRLLAGFKKQNNGSSPLPCLASSSSSSSASTDVQTHLDNLLTSQLNDRSPEELAQASKATAALAVKIAKAARAAANEKAIIASKAIAAAKNALALFASFRVEAKEMRKNKQKRHVPVQRLYSTVADEDLARRLNRAINNSARNCVVSHRNKKQKSVVISTMYDGNDVAGVVDSDSDDDEEVERTRVNGLKEKIGEESSLLGKRRGRVKLKKLPLSMCGSKDQENGITAAQPEGSNGGVAQVRS